MKNKNLLSVISLPKIIAMILLVGGALIIHACASSQTSVQSKNESENKNLNKDEQSFDFYDTTGGQETQWSAIFKNHKLQRLYKNSIQLPDSVISDYKDLVYNKLDALPGRHHKYNWVIPDLQFDSSFTGYRIQPFRNHYFGTITDSNFPFFDSKKFQIEMDSLQNELGRLKDFKFQFKFDSAGFNNQMKKFVEKLKNMKFDSSEFKLNMKEFEKNMKEFEKDMKNKKFWFNYDLSDLRNRLNSLDKNIFELNIDMSKVNERLKKLNEFLEAVKKELVKDGILHNQNDEAEIILGPDSMTVNGRKLSASQLEKYKELYSKYFSDKLTEIEHFHLN